MKPLKIPKLTGQFSGNFKARAAHSADGRFESNRMRVWCSKQVGEKPNSQRNSISSPILLRRFSQHTSRHSFGSSSRVGKTGWGYDGGGGRNFAYTNSFSLHGGQSRIRLAGIASLHTSTKSSASYFLGSGCRDNSEFSLAPEFHG